MLVHPEVNTHEVDVKTYFKISLQVILFPTVGCRVLSYKCSLGPEIEEYIRHLIHSDGWENH